MIPTCVRCEIGNDQTPKLFGMALQNTLVAEARQNRGPAQESPDLQIGTPPSVEPSKLKVEALPADFETLNLET